MSTDSSLTTSATPSRRGSRSRSLSPIRRPRSHSPSSVMKRKPSRSPSPSLSSQGKRLRSRSRSGSPKRKVVRSRSRSLSPERKQAQLRPSGETSTDSKDSASPTGYRVRILCAMTTHHRDIADNIKKHLNKHQVQAEIEEFQRFLIEHKELNIPDNFLDMVEKLNAVQFYILTGLLETLNLDFYLKLARGHQEEVRTPDQFFSIDDLHVVYTSCFYYNRMVDLYNKLLKFAHPEVAEAGRRVHAKRVVPEREAVDALIASIQSLRFNASWLVRQIVHKFA